MKCMPPYPTIPRRVVIGPSSTSQKPSNHHFLLHILLNISKPAPYPPPRSRSKRRHAAARFLNAIIKCRSDKCPNILTLPSSTFGRLAPVLESVMHPVQVRGAQRSRAVLAAAGLLLLAMAVVSFLGAAPTTVLSRQMKLHKNRPVLSVLVAVSDGSMVYTINGAPAYTFKEDSAFSPPKGDSNFMQSHLIEGSTLVRC
jgi:hypothetical protein